MVGIRRFFYKGEMVWEDVCYVRIWIVFIGYGELDFRVEKVRIINY